MMGKILCVDDDANILEAYKRQLRKQFAIETALGGEAGLEMVRTSGPFAVVVSDMRMPGMNGVQFLAAVRECAPTSVRVMLTGQAEMADAIAAVNEGNIFRFLTKPCPPEILTKALEAALEQYRLITAERTLLEKTLRGSVKVLTDVLSLANPVAFGRASRLKRYVRHMVTQLHLPNEWRFEVAAMLSQIGCVVLPPDTLEKVYAGEPLSDEEQKMVASSPGVGHDLVANIPHLEAIAGMIAKQQEPLADVKSVPELRSRDIVSLGGHLLKVALDFDQLVTRDMSPAKAMAALLKQPKVYDKEVVSALQGLDTGEREMEVRLVKMGDLYSGMFLGEDIRTTTGALVIAKGHEVTRAVMERLERFTQNVEVVEPFRVLVPRDTP